MNKKELLEEYKQELNRVGKSAKTIDSYLRNVNLFLSWLSDTEGKEFDGSITLTDTRFYTSHLTNNERAALSSINAKLSAIQSFADFMHHKHDMNPIKIEKKKGKVTPKVEVLDRTDLYQFIKYVDNNANLLHKTIVYTFLHTGIREEELVNLELDDIVNLDSTKNSKIIIRDGKGSKYREIAISGEYKKILKEYMDHRPLSDSNKVFLGNRGTLTPNGVYKIISRLGQQKGFHVYPHMLRHQFATASARNCENAQDIKDLSVILGHSSIDTTMRYYVSESKDNQRRIIEELKYI